MNEITRIHLAKVPYEIELDAKRELERYVGDIHSAMDDEALADDVEVRMTELLGERGVQKEGVITKNDVDALKGALGQPNNFSDDTSDNTHKESRVYDKGQPERRFMRDETTGWLAGVCSGIAQYFNIPIWVVRLAVVVLSFVSFGIAVFAYLVLWLLVPAVKHRSDKLQLQGVSTTIHSMSEAQGNMQISNAVRLMQTLIKVAGIALLSFAILLAMIMLGAVAYVLTFLIDITGVPEATVALTVGVVCVLLAIMVAIAGIAAIASRKLRKKASIVMLVGFILGTGVTTVWGLMAVPSADLLMAKNSKHIVYESRMQPDFSVAKKLLIKGDERSKIVYVATDSEPRVVVKKSPLFRGAATYQVNTANDTIVVELNDGNGRCENPSPRCAYDMTFELHGPLLNTVELEGHNSFNFQYKGEVQPKIIIDGVVNE